MSATELPSPPPPSSEPDKPSWWKRKLWKFPVWAWLVGAFIGLAVISNLTEKDKVDDAASGTTVTVTAPQATAPTTPLMTSAPSTVTAPPIETPADSVPMMVAWYEAHGDLFNATLDEMNQASAAAQKSDFTQAERSARVVAGNMDVLARSLTGESNPGAVASRNAFDSCAVAFENAANALSDLDSEAMSAATALINECNSAMTVAAEAIKAG